mgnify:FL=1
MQLENPRLMSESQTPAPPYRPGYYNDASLADLGAALCLIGEAMQNPGVRVDFGSVRNRQTVNWLVGNMSLRGILYNLDQVWYSPANYDRTAK